MGAPAIFDKQIEIKLLHPAFTEDVTDGSNHKSMASKTSYLQNYIAKQKAEVISSFGFLIIL
ncbi:MAG: hypothetical protein P8X74_04505 [Reinekea sp.]|jgi:hypothetical protein